MENRKALGRGLEQLFNSDNLDIESIENQIYETSTQDEIVELPLNELRPNPYQPRKTFDEEALEELANSIREHGVFQPIIAKKSIKGYEIIAGERRVRASRLAGLETIPAILRDFTDEQMIQIALLENIQRENLNAIEEAIAYKQMIEKLDLTQEELSHKLGKSRSHVTNMLGLLRLPTSVQDMVIKKEITMGHARVLSKLESEEQMIKMAHDIVENKMPVRTLEEVSTQEEKKVKMIRKNPASEYKYIEDILRDKFDTKIRIKDKKIEISFQNTADLNRILEIIDIKEI